MYESFQVELKTVCREVTSEIPMITLYPRSVHELNTGGRPGLETNYYSASLSKVLTVQGYPIHKPEDDEALSPDDDIWYALCGRTWQCVWTIHVFMNFYEQLYGPVAKIMYATYLNVFSLYIYTLKCDVNRIMIFKKVDHKSKIKKINIVAGLPR